MFAITDTGKGMDSATAMHALDPFFTTNLAGEGTTIKLYFPRDVGQESFQPRQVAALAGTETVLLVDDYEIVRATVVSMLKGLGYEVITASGAEAISILEKDSAIVFVFTDVVMRDTVSGRKLAVVSR